MFKMPALPIAALFLVFVFCAQAVALTPPLPKGHSFKEFDEGPAVGVKESTESAPTTIQVRTIPPTGNRLSGIPRAKRVTPAPPPKPLVVAKGKRRRLDLGLRGFFSFMAPTKEDLDRAMDYVMSGAASVHTRPGPSWKKKPLWTAR